MTDKEEEEGMPHQTAAVSPRTDDKALPFFCNIPECMDSDCCAHPAADTIGRHIRACVNRFPFISLLRISPLFADGYVIDLHLTIPPRRETSNSQTTTGDIGAVHKGVIEAKEGSQGRCDAANDSPGEEEEGTATAANTAAPKDCSSQNGSPVASYEREEQYVFRLYLPKEYPHVAPSLCCMNVMYHSQILQTGFVPEPLVDYWIQHGMELYEGSCLDQLDFDGLDPFNTVAAVALLAFAMLHTNVPEPPSPLDDPGSPALEELWEEHDPSCTCLINQCMPCSFSSYAARDSSEERRDLLNAFRDRFGRRHRLLFEKSCESFAFRQQILSKWVRSYPHDDFMALAYAVNPSSSAESIISCLCQLLHPELFSALFDAVPSLFASDGGKGKASCCQQEKLFLADITKAQAKHAIAIADALHALVREEADGVYSMPFFSERACQALDAEVRAFRDSGLPHTRPNSMNRYGAILNDLGLEGLFDVVLAVVADPIRGALFPALFCGCSLDSQHTFAIQYSPAEDRMLDMHTDDSDLTINVNLLDEFTGSQLTFCGMRGSQGHRKRSIGYTHKRGRAVVHQGLLRHGAQPILDGYRSNVVLWGKSARYRMTGAYQQALRRDPSEEDPDTICLSHTHDHDYHLWMEDATSKST